MIEVHFGSVEKPAADWRKAKRLKDFDPDDELLQETPEDVIAILGFDPLELEDKSELAVKSLSAAQLNYFRKAFSKLSAAAKSAGNCGANAQGGGGFQRGNTCASGGTDGKPKQTDTQEFKRWFGDSKAVDDNGEPLVLYHGTGNAFTVFGTSSDTESLSGARMGVGHYFTDDPERASKYAKGDFPNVKPVFLSVQNPFDHDAELTEEQVKRIESAIGNAMGDSVPLHASPIVSEEFPDSEKMAAWKLFDKKMEEWEQHGDGYDRAKPKESRTASGGWKIDYRKRGAAGVSKDPVQTWRDLFSVFGPDATIILREAGFDGAKRGDEWVVFERYDIKSAIGNDGDFDPANPDITKSFRKASSCGANKQGGGGFQPGNTCASGANRAGASIDVRQVSNDAGKPVYTLHAIKDGEEIGWMQLVIDRDYEQALADTIVEEPYRRQGVATDMYVEAAKLAQKHGAYLEPNNMELSEDAQALWQSFKDKGISDGYSIDPEKLSLIGSAEPEAETADEMPGFINKEILTANKELVVDLFGDRFFDYAMGQPEGKPFLNAWAEFTMQDHEPKPVSTQSVIAERLASGSDPTDEQRQWLSDNREEKEAVHRLAAEKRFEAMGTTAEEALREAAIMEITDGDSNDVAIPHLAMDTDESMQYWKDRARTMEAVRWHLGDDWDTKFQVEQARAILADPSAFTDMQLSASKNEVQSDGGSEEYFGLIDEIDRRRDAAKQWLSEASTEEIADKLTVITHDEAFDWELSRKAFQDRLDSMPGKIENLDPVGFSDTLGKREGSQAIAGQIRERFGSESLSSELKFTADEKRRGDIKESNAIAISKALADVPNESVERFIKSQPSSSVESLGMKTEDDRAVVAAVIQSQWAASSGDHDERSIALQIAVANAFEFEPSIGGSTKEYEAKGRAVYEEHKEVYDGFVSAVYAQTQRDLKQAGVTHVELYRGMTLSDQYDRYLDLNANQKQLRNIIELREVTAAEPNAGDYWVSDHDIEANPASSYSLSSKTAAEFVSGRGNIGVIVADRVPAEDVFSTFFSGIGCAIEEEVVVLGRKRRAKLVMTTGNPPQSHEDIVQIIKESK